LWQASTYLAGKNRRISTKEESLSHAKEIAEDWYLELRGKARAGVLKTGKLFRDAAKHFLAEYIALIAGERNPKYVASYELKLRVHLLPFFGDKVLSEITPGLVQQYRVHRAQQKTQMGKPPSRSTLHQEIVALRQVLKSGNRQGWLAYVPDLSPPYKASGKITHRAWFSPDEYKKLYEATRRRADKPLKKRWKWECEQLHDYVLFMANTGLRPDEAARLEFRDVTVVKDHATSETILEIEVRGKRGIGFCKSTANAVLPFKRSKERLRLKKNASTPGEMELAKPDPTDRLFPSKPQYDSGRRRSQERPRRQDTHGLQLEAHLYLLSPHGGGGHLSDREKLPHERRDDRKVLCRAHQDDARRSGYQCAPRHDQPGTADAQGPGRRAIVAIFRPRLIAG
jgi:integrase